MLKIIAMHGAQQTSSEVRGKPMKRILNGYGDFVRSSLKHHVGCKMLFYDDLTREVDIDGLQRPYIAL